MKRIAKRELCLISSSSCSAQLQSTKALTSLPQCVLHLQVTKESVLKEACQDSQLCVVSVLPHIYDCQSECRQGYLDILKRLGDKYKRNRWGWLWSEAMAQPKLEEALEIGGFGYPALAVLNSRKMKYSLLRGSFSYDGINEFLREVAVGRGSSVPVKGAKLPEVVETEPWDGKDAKVCGQ